MKWHLEVCVTLASLVVASALGVNTRGSQLDSREQESSSFLRTLGFKQKLRVCNAYPHHTPLEIVIDGKEAVTKEPLPYKACVQMQSTFPVGTEVDFKADGIEVGSFTIADLPESDATLLLVIYRHDTVSTAVAFKSHVYANAESAQIAALDTYQGNDPSTELRIEDVPSTQGDSKAEQARSEILRFNSVVAVNDGKYAVSLFNRTGGVLAKSEIDTKQQEQYVVLRCGVTAEEGESYPEELLVFPGINQGGCGAVLLRHIVLINMLVLLVTSRSL
mmetsp:Transcript_45139/g.104586  ORF Transcript_45139/g.104586 Transcript_45139/m.104586 type:complete len:276 (-) Transcript_45139:71-898(-)